MVLTPVVLQRVEDNTYKIYVYTVHHVTGAQYQQRA